MDHEWQQVRNRLQKSISRGQFDLWVSTVNFLGYDDGCMTLGCKNRFHIEWLRERLEVKIMAAAREEFQGLRRIDYRVVDVVNQKEDEELVLGRPVQVRFSDVVKPPAAPAFNPRFTFDQFVVGQSNQFAYATAMAMASSQGFYRHSAYILSGTGLGKSHLSHAVGNYLAANRPDLRVQYSTAEQFANEMISALRNGSIETFKSKFRQGCDVLLLEKVEFLSGKNKIQNELLYTFDELLDHGKKILVTGNALPRDIPKLNSDLQSRLNGILVAPIEQPDFRTRIEIIQRKGRMENMRLPMDVVEYLADRVTGDIRKLESCVVGLVVKSSVLNMPVSIDLAAEVSGGMLNRLDKLTVAHIQRVVCDCFGVSVEDLVSNSRKREIATARKIAMYLSRKYTAESLNSIGKSFHRGHTSVLYAVNMTSKSLDDNNSKLKRELDYVSRRLQTSCVA